jgi:hypothetical protein
MTISWRRVHDGSVGVEEGALSTPRRRAAKLIARHDARGDGDFIIGYKPNLCLSKLGTNLPDF